MRALPLLVACAFLVACLEDPVSEVETEDGVVDGGSSDSGEDRDPDAAPIADVGAVEADAAGPEADAGALPEICLADQDCPTQLQGCYEGTCVDRCLGPGTCFRGGRCVDGLCIPAECEADGDCEGELLCREQTCVEPSPCDTSDDCGADQRCEAGNCEPLPACGGDRNCADDEICQDGLCRERDACEGRGDCGEAEDCVAGRCVPFVCRGDVDCGGAEVCNAGSCVPQPDVEVERVVILSRPRTLVVGQALQLRAAALDVRGDIIATRGFLWSTSDDQVAAVEAGTGALQAGPEVGAVEVVASFRQPNGDELASAPLALVVVEPEVPEAGVRVRVTDGAAPVVGALVRAGDAEGLTGEDGAVELDAARGAPITVFSEDHDYVTLVGVEAAEIRVPLQPRSADARVAGFTGAISFDDVATMGDVDLGLAGASIGGGLTHLDLERLVGQLFNVPLEAGPLSTDIPLPGGITLSATVPILGRVELKDRYYALSEPGLRIGWAFAGRIDLNVVIQLARGGGGFDAGRVLATLLPFFDSFQHGLRVAEELVALPRRPDEDDVDGDGDQQELVPDYERFPVLDNEPAMEQRLRLGVSLPALGDGQTALLFAGVEVEEVGFVPMGVTASTEAGDFPMRMAAPYGGLEAGDAVVLAIAGEFGGGGFAVPASVTVALGRFPDRVPNEVELPAPLAFADAVEWDAALRSVGGGAVDGATLHRAVFRGEAGRWTVYFAGAPEVTLPFPPEGTADLAAGAELRFEALQGPALGTLVGPEGEGDLLDLDRLTTAFSRVVP